jgi:hydrogenase maturation protease
MIRPIRHLVIGIGSAHGDDRAGWQLIDALMLRKQHASVGLRKASVPHDMIDWMDDCQRLHIVDACESNSDRVQRLDRSEGRIAIENMTRSRGSHQIGVGDVLELAESLGKLPPHVTVWAIPGAQFRVNQTISEPCRDHVERCADLIQGELDHA